MSDPNGEFNNCPFKVGDQIDIPKGTALFARYGSPTITKRDSTASIKQIYIEKQWVDYLSPTDRTAYDADMQADREEWQRIDESFRSVNRRIEDENYEAWSKALDDHREKTQDLYDKYEKLAYPNLTPHDFIICWGSNNQARATQVTKSTAVPKAKKPAKLSLRQQMIKGTKWKVLEDILIMSRLRNPEIDRLLDIYRQANPEPAPYVAVQIMYQGKPMMAQQHNPVWDTWRTAFNHEQKRVHDSVDYYIDDPYVEIKAGTIFEVTGKTQQSWYRTYHHETFSVVVPVKRVGGSGKEFMLPIDQLKDKIEMEGTMPTVPVFVLRHKPSGKFFKGTSYTGRRGQYGVDFSDTAMSGKQFTDVGKAKSSILSATGYYDGLPGSENLPEWMGGPKTMDFNGDYELVEFDKLTRTEQQVIDLMPWFERTWQLRELTMKFGSSVRKVYNELEKKELLATQKGMIVFTVTDEDKLDEVGYWGDRTALTDEDKEEIDKALATANLKKGSFRRATDHCSCAISFPNKGSAMLFKLGYTGNLKVSVLDLEDLKEAVDG